MRRYSSVTSGRYMARTKGVSAVGQRREFCASVLEELHGGRGAVPQWKRKLLARVDRAPVGSRVLRRPLDFSADKASVAPLPASAGDDQASSPVPSPHMKRVSPAGRPNGAPAEAHTAQTLSRAQRETIKETHAKVQYHADSVHDMELEGQFLDEASAQAVDSLAIANGELAARAKDEDPHARIVRRRDKLLGQVAQTERRASEAKLANGDLAKVIGTLRAERRTHVMCAREAKSRVSAMESDSKHFASIALTSLDEAEKVEARLRRMHHDVIVERRQHASTLAQIDLDLASQDRALQLASAAEEEAVEEDRRGKYVRARDARTHSERRARRMDYLQAQVSPAGDGLP